jgi:peptidoglycan/LPS O-acetylase OafA/YrhL
MTALVVSSAIRRDHWMAWLFDWEPFQSVGRVSYGMYLMHQLCINVIKRVVPALPPIGLFAAGSVVTYGVALVSYRYYESIFLRIKERYSRTPPPVVTKPVRETVGGPG